MVVIQMEAMAWVIEFFFVPPLRRGGSGGLIRLQAR